MYSWLIRFSVLFEDFINSMQFFLTTNVPRLVPTIHLLIEYQILRPPTDFRIFKILNFYYKHSIRTEAQEEFNGEKKNEKEERRRKKSDKHGGGKNV